MPEGVAEIIGGAVKSVGETVGGGAKSLGETSGKVVESAGGLTEHVSKTTIGGIPEGIQGEPAIDHASTAIENPLDTMRVASDSDILPTKSDRPSLGERLEGQQANFGNMYGDIKKVDDRERRDEQEKRRIRQKLQSIEKTVQRIDRKT